jgi:Domain of unknown function (DUF6883)
MRLPNWQKATVPQSKIVGYLLAPGHPFGRFKAAFFDGFGFSAREPGILVSALIRHARENEVTKVEDSPFGRRYVIGGVLNAPDGRKPVVRCIWFIETGESVPQLVTAYPLKRRSDAT